MQISILFFTVLREITNKKAEIVTFEEEKLTINMVLKRLSEKFGKRFIEYIYNPQSEVVRGHLQFFVNGQSATTIEGLETMLVEGDILAIVPPVSGG